MEREELSEATKARRCIFCQRPFLVPIAFSKRVQGKFSCDRCVEKAWTLRQSYILSLQGTSSEELVEIAASLLPVSQPCAGAFHQAPAST